MLNYLVLSAVGVEMYFINSRTERPPPLADTASACQCATDPFPTPPSCPLWDGAIVSRAPNIMLLRFRLLRPYWIPQTSSNNISDGSNPKLVALLCLNVSKNLIRKVTRGGLDDLLRSGSQYKFLLRLSIWGGFLKSSSKNFSLHIQDRIVWYLESRNGNSVSAASSGWLFLHL
jgi:hypothetical protein